RRAEGLDSLLDTLGSAATALRHVGLTATPTTDQFGERGDELARRQTGVTRLGGGGDDETHLALTGGREQRHHARPRSQSITHLAGELAQRPGVDLLVESLGDDGDTGDLSSPFGERRRGVQ